MLKRHEDAYGQMMLDYLRDGSGNEIVEHADGHFGIGAWPSLREGHRLAGRAYHLYLAFARVLRGGAHPRSTR